jgi:hypothetical protein
MPPPTSPTTPPEKKTAAPAAVDNLLGLTAESSDGTTVRSVFTNPGGKTSIGVKVGSFLGFGGHMAAIPHGKFNRVGDTVEVNMTAEARPRLIIALISFVSKLIISSFGLLISIEISRSGRISVNSFPGC